MSSPGATSQGLGVGDLGIKSDHSPELQDCISKMDGFLRRWEEKCLLHLQPLGPLGNLWPSAEKLWVQFTVFA